MTPTEHKKIETALKCRITKTRNRMRAAMFLTDKILIGREVKELENQLHLHRLNYCAPQ